MLILTDHCELNIGTLSISFLYWIHRVSFHLSRTWINDEFSHMGPMVLVLFHRGWGLHSETLGEELGLYETPEDRMGQLSMEALRSCRLVVDTGMHAKGWTEKQAVEYMLSNTAMGEHDATTEVRRYITWPGQACAYKVGERFLRRLRTKAEDALGERFDPRDFYDVVLQCGPIPLDLLETLVDDYISKVRDATESEPQADGQVDSEFLEQMSFATWCKCCIVPGSCRTG